MIQQLEGIIFNNSLTEFINKQYQNHLYIFCLKHASFLNIHMEDSKEINATFLEVCILIIV